MADKRELVSGEYLEYKGKPLVSLPSRRGYCSPVTVTPSASAPRQKREQIPAADSGKRIVSSVTAVTIWRSPTR